MAHHRVEHFTISSPLAQPIGATLTVMARRNLLNLALLATATALSLSPKARAPTRSEFFKGAAAFSAAAAVGAAAPASAATTLPSGLKYEVIKSNPNGAIPKIGDLIAIRFKGSTEGRVFDDITKTDEPLYYRVGGGSLIKVHIHTNDPSAVFETCTSFSRTPMLLKEKASKSIRAQQLASRRSCSQRHR